MKIYTTEDEAEMAAKVENLGSDYHVYLVRKVKGGYIITAKD